MQGSDFQNIEKCHLERSREVRLFSNFVLDCAQTDRKVV